MIDIHSHILPGIDDGASDPEISLEMARMAAKDGIHAIFATPHVQLGDDISPEEIKEKVAQLNDLIAAHNIPLAIYPGAEVRIGSEICSWANYCLHNGPYILVEFIHTHITVSAREQLHELQREGLIPIIAHPERNGAILQRPDLLVELLASGCKAQITAESVTGELGPQVQHCSHYLLRKKAVHFLATDSHSPSFRKPQLKKALKIVGRIMGKKQAEQLVNEYPEAVLNGTTL